MKNKIIAIISFVIIIILGIAIVKNVNKEDINPINEMENPIPRGNMRDRENMGRMDDGEDEVVEYLNDVEIKDEDIVSEKK